MKKEFHKKNREVLYDSLEPGSFAVLFSGHAPRKTGDEYYPFFANRSFVYMTGYPEDGPATENSMKSSDFSMNVPMQPRIICSAY